MFIMIYELLIMLAFPLYARSDFDCNFKFDKYREEVFFTLNSTIDIRCEPIFNNSLDICGTVDIEIMWLHNTSRLNDIDGKRKIVSYGRNLVIFYAQPSDAGEYMCDSEGKDGNVSKTFVLRLTDSSVFHTTIIENLLPPRGIDEKKGHIYWLPEMLTKDVQQNNVRNPGDDQEFYGAYYTSSDDHLLQVDWFFQYESTNQRTIIEQGRYHHTQEYRTCNTMKFMPRAVVGKCYFSLLVIPKVNFAQQGLYHSVARLIRNMSATTHLNLTYSLRINRIKIDEPNSQYSGDARLTFNLDTKVCRNDFFDIKCEVSPDKVSSDFYTVIEKLHPNFTEVISTAEIKSINITDVDGHVVNKAEYVTRSSITHRIKSVAFSDAGVYECTATPIHLLTYRERQYYVLRSVMNLTVISCTVQPSASLGANVTTWWVVVLFVVLLSLMLSIYCCHYYYNSCLIKTVIIKHPNKLYVSQDGMSGPLILPDISIRTCHRFRLQHNNFCAQQKPRSRVCMTPFSQKLSKYIPKTCIFNYGRINVSESSPVIDKMELSNADSSRTSSNSTMEDSKSQEYIVQNNTRTQYRFPSNIGWALSQGSVVIGSKIGEGAFGIVYDGVAKTLAARSSPVNVAIKTLHDSFGDEDLINLVKEVEMLKLIGAHPHIIALYGTYVENGHPYMVMELAKNGNLRDFLRSRRNQTNVLRLHESLGLNVSSISLPDLLRFSLEIAYGMEFLSSKMIIHRDLAARNILVDQFLEVKIADFGLTRAVENYYRKWTDGRLPIKWMAPECLLDRVYTVKSDVWSFGIVLWEIFTMGQTPYSTVQPNSMHQALRTGLRNERPVFASDEIYGTMLATWNDDPVERPSFTDLVVKLSQIRSPEMVPAADCLCDGEPPVDTDPPRSMTVKDYLMISNN